MTDKEFGHIGEEECMIGGGTVGIFFPFGWEGEANLLVKERGV